MTLFAREKCKETAIKEAFFSKTGERKKIIRPGYNGIFFPKNRSINHVARDVIIKQIKREIYINPFRKVTDLPSYSVLSFVADN